MSEEQKASYVERVVDPGRFTNYGIKRPEGKRKIRQALPIVKEEEEEIEEDESSSPVIEEKTFNVIEETVENYSASDDYSSTSDPTPTPTPSSPPSLRPSNRLLNDPTAMSEDEKRKYVEMVTSTTRFKNYNETLKSNVGGVDSLSKRLEERARIEEEQRQANRRLLSDATLKAERKKKESILIMTEDKVQNRAKYKVQASEAERTKERLRREAERKMEDYWERKVKEEGKVLRPNGSSPSPAQPPPEPVVAETDDEKMERIEAEEKRREEEEFKRMVEEREKEIVRERERAEEEARAEEVMRVREEERAALRRVEEERIRLEQERIEKEIAEKERVEFEKEEAARVLREEQERKQEQLRIVEEQKKAAAMEKIRMAEEEARLIREKLEAENPAGPIRQKVDLSGLSGVTVKKDGGGEKPKPKPPPKKAISEEDKKKAAKFGIKLDDL